MKWSEFPRSYYFSIAIFLLAVFSSQAGAGGTSVLKGKVVDAGGQPVEGARIFVYDSVNVRRSANFISGPTDKDGLFRLVIKPGRYWSLARLKKAEGYGPLMTGDKHSGEPGEIVVAPGEEIERDFTVADLKEARRIRTREREGLVKISGRIIDQKGLPVTKAYVIANRTGKVSGMPDFFSAWVTIDGRYTLYLPAGKFYIGSAVTFPPEQPFFLKKPITVDADRSDLDIVRTSPEKK